MTIEKTKKKQKMHIEIFVEKLYVEINE